MEKLEFRTQCMVDVVMLHTMMDAAGTFTELEGGVDGHVAMRGSAFEGLKYCMKGCTHGHKVGITAVQGRGDGDVYLC